MDDTDIRNELADLIIVEFLQELDASIIRRIELGLPIDDSSEGFNSSNPP